MKKLLLYYTIICFLMLIPFAFATDYHVDATGGAANWAACSGADPGNGSRCSMTQANAGADDDAVVYLHDDGGNFTTAIVPANSGSSGHVITFKNATGETPVIDGDDGTPLTALVNLYGKEYITIDGITMQDVGWSDSPENTRKWSILINDGSAMKAGVTIQNCDIADGGIYTKGSSALTIKDNNIHDVEFAGINLSGHVTNRSTQTLIEGNTFTGNFVGTDVITYHESSGYPNGYYHVIRNNIISTSGGYPEGENCLDITSGRYFVIDGNECSGSLTYAGFGIGEHDVDNEALWIRLINNKVFETGSGNHGVVLVGDETDYVQILKNQFYGGGEHAIGIDGEDATNGIRHVRLYHNTFDGRYYRDNLLLDLQEVISDLSFKNNIFYMTTGDYAMIWTDPGGADMLSDYNLYWNVGVGAGADLWGNTYKTLAAIRTNYSREVGGVEADPLLVDPATNDYRITSSSPAYNAAGPLTQINDADDCDAGTEDCTIMVVDDALWFYDGWGITGEVGDYIYVDNPAEADFIEQISSINYTTNTITLSTEHTFENNANVYLSSATAIINDIGYYEVGGTATPTVSISATDAEGAEEGTATVEFTITCSPVCAAETINFTYSGGAVLNTDYNCANGEDVEDGDIAITGATDTITCTPVDDSDPETAETITITLTSGTGYTVGSPSQANATITDNDGAQDAVISGMSGLGAGTGKITYDSTGTGSWTR